MGSLSDSSLGWASSSNLANGSPLCESASHSIVLSASLTKSIKSLSGSLSISSSNIDESCVDLNTAVNASSSEDLNELLGAIGSGVANSLIEHDDTADVLLNTWGGEKHLSVSLSVGMVVLNANAVESLSNGASGLISSENTLARGADVFAGLDELFLEVTTSVCFALHF